MKYLKLLFVPAFAFALSATVISCGGDDSSDGGSNTQKPDNGQGQISGALSEDEQKKLLEQTARNLLAEINANDFQTIVDIAEYVEDNLSSDRQSYEIEDWFNAAVELANGNYSNGVQKRLYLASNFTGAFEYKSNRWQQTREGGNNLQFTFPDATGRSCVVTITPSGTVYKIHHEEFDEYDYDWDYYSYDYNKTKVGENTIGVPEKLTATLTQAGNTLVSVTINTTITSGSEIRLSRDVAEVAFTTTVSGYTLNVNKAVYHGNSSASVKAELSKNGKTLITTNVSANIKLNDDGEVTKISDAKVYADALGEVQINGDCSDVDKFNNYLEAAERNDDDETLYKQNLNKANNLLNLGLYYNGSSNRMAYVQLYPTKVRDYGYEYWYHEPVIFFRDGSGYSSLESFFDESYFSSVIRRFENLLDDFERLVK